MSPVLQGIINMVEARLEALGDNKDSPVAIAGVFVVVALMIYRMQLTADEYDEMVDTISESRELVAPRTDQIDPSITVH